MDAPPPTRARRMTLPSLDDRVDPIYKGATEPPSDPAHGAAFIFLHGLGDSGEGLENIANQFQAADKLPYMHWILPTAPSHHDAMMTAWYTPHTFTLFPPNRPELEPDEDEAGLVASIEYVENLIAACNSKGIPPNRIVVGGFSQGCALSLLLDLVSAKYGGKLAGVVGLMGYLPLSAGRRLEDLRARAGLDARVGGVEIFLARGERDQLVPRRIHNASVKRLNELGLDEGSMEIHEYEGLGHSVNAQVLRDMCAFLERVVPNLDD